MTKPKKIAVIGDEETVFLFKLVGVLEAYPAKGRDAARELLKRIAQREDYALVVLTQNLADELGRELEEMTVRFKNLAVVVLPSRTGSSIKKVDVLKEIVRRAVGFEVFVK